MCFVFIGMISKHKECAMIDDTKEFMIVPHIYDNITTQNNWLTNWRSKRLFDWHSNWLSDKPMNITRDRQLALKKMVDFTTFRLCVPSSLSRLFILLCVLLLLMQLNLTFIKNKNNKNNTKRTEKLYYYKKNLLGNFEERSVLHLILFMCTYISFKCAL